MSGSSKYAREPDARIDANGIQQVVINVGDHNFGDIFPREHVKFIERLKNAGNRSTDDDESD
ncbi:hypothetical protein BG006_004017, partial [Podila minutissima]